MQKITRLALLALLFILPGAVVIALTYLAYRELVKLANKEEWNAEKSDKIRGK